MDIERRCFNCEYNDTYGCGECMDLEDFQPRKDLVELHGKLRKAVEALRKIKDSNAGCEILWQAKDTDGSWYDVHVKDYVGEILEELQ